MDNEISKEDAKKILAVRRAAARLPSIHHTTADYYVRWMLDAPIPDFTSNDEPFCARLAFWVHHQKDNALSVEQMRFATNFFQNFEGIPLFAKRSNATKLHHQEFDELNDFAWFAQYEGAENDFIITKDIENDINETCRLLKTADQDLCIKATIGYNVCAQLDWAEEGQVSILHGYKLDPAGMDYMNLDEDHERFLRALEEEIKNRPSGYPPGGDDQYSDRDAFLRDFPWRSQRLLFIQRKEERNIMYKEFMDMKFPEVERVLGLTPDDEHEKPEEEGWKTGEPDEWAPDEPSEP